MGEREDHERAAAAAIRALRQRVRWKPGKADQHLRTRQALGHLPATASLHDYDALIQSVLGDACADVYLYPFGARDYYAIGSDAPGAYWLVLFGSDGTMETAFPPDDPEGYIQARGFVPLGRLDAVASEQA